MAGRKLFGRRRDIIWVALVAAALSVPAAIADEAGSAGLKKDVKKALALAKKAKKKAGAANKKAKNALEVAEATSKQEGPEGPQGPKGDKGEPGVAGTVPVESSTVAATNSTASAAWTDLGGPSVTVDVGANGGFVQLFASSEINGGTNAATSCAVLVSSPALVDGVLIMQASNTNNAFQSQFNDTPKIRLVAAGTHTFKFEYTRFAGTTNCQFRNRTLTVGVFNH